MAISRSHNKTYLYSAVWCVIAMTHLNLSFFSYRRSVMVHLSMIKRIALVIIYCGLTMALEWKWQIQGYRNQLSDIPSISDCLWCTKCWPYISNLYAMNFEIIVFALHNFFVEWGNLGQEKSKWTSSIVRKNVLLYPRWE